jgi:hypothetical protein
VCFNRPKSVKGLVNRAVMSKQSDNNVPPADTLFRLRVLRSVTESFYGAQGSDAQKPVIK